MASTVHIAAKAGTGLLGDTWRAIRATRVIDQGGQAVSENVELVRSIYADWERGDWSSAWWAHPAIEFAIADGLEPGTRTGIDAMAASWLQWLSAWEDYRIRAEEYRELDDERVLVLHEYSGRGRTSGLDIGATWSKAATLFHVCEGKITRLVGYNNRELALADLRLEA